jgi:hypothetical protein
MGGGILATHALRTRAPTDNFSTTDVEGGAMLGGGVDGGGAAVGGVGVGATVGASSGDAAHGGVPGVGDATYGAAPPWAAGSGKAAMAEDSDETEPPPEAYLKMAAQAAGVAADDAVATTEVAAMLEVAASAPPPASAPPAPAAAPPALPTLVESPELPADLARAQPLPPPALSVCVGVDPLVARAMALGLDSIATLLATCALPPPLPPPLPSPTPSRRASSAGRGVRTTRHEADGAASAATSRTPASSRNALPLSTPLPWYLTSTQKRGRAPHALPADAHDAQATSGAADGAAGGSACGVAGGAAGGVVGGVAGRVAEESAAEGAGGERGVLVIAAAATSPTKGGRVATEARSKKRGRVEGGVPSDGPTESFDLFAL